MLTRSDFEMSPLRQVYNLCSKNELSGQKDKNHLCAPHDRGKTALPFSLQIDKGHVWLLANGERSDF